jgi:6-phosphogluconolactonase (cycloisomerase 2 family)
MRTLTRLASATAIAAAGLAVLAGQASASVSKPDHHGSRGDAGQVVFVQTDNTAGNEVVAYHRAHDGTLTQAGQYPTGGLGGILAGSQVDHLASQGSLGYDQAARTLIAVNAGSSTVSVFGTHGSTLHLRQVISSGGTFPVSVAIHGRLVYVLNALDGGSVQAFRLIAGRLLPLAGSARALGLDPNATPQFTNTPGQVSFSPDGSQLIVTTKANGNDIDVFAVSANGSLTAAPVVNAEPGTVPFAISFDQAGHLVIAEAGPNALATFALSPSGTVTLLDSVGTGQAATCWVAPARGLLFASNAGSASISGYAADPDGTLTLLGSTTTDPGTVDASASPDGRFLYVQTGGAGVVDEFRVGLAGSLTEIGSVTVPGAVGAEGIVAG